ncbi:MULTISPECIES: aconitate hydratase AcnA [unclassified Labrenzia]|uniref:aconitate hydratase AcnA n=1 Tax=unclassified Labrenzia TaxID=2648686 RepID=UPI001268EACB|nr:MULTISPECIES: aconitate hydratase AcnA [unclassified Labrenzia]QFT08052.1 Aconitate hydratase 1 [Labrenzia sp. THAF191a]QFT19583.1 Aconitate hydratase 1 [Labrenzia sp. THAF187b]
MTSDWNTGADLTVADKTYRYASLARLQEAVPGAVIERLPFVTRVLLENLLRHVDGTKDAAERVAAVARGEDVGDIEFFPARVLMPDSSGVPLLADLTAMRSAVAERGGDPSKVNPKIPAELVVDHSVVTQFAGTADAERRNIALEYELNAERYTFLKWAEANFRNFRLFSPGKGIVHQVNLEYLARPVRSAKVENTLWAYPDTLVGMDSHTPTINGLGVMGWGVGGIEAGGALLGLPISMAFPDVVGCRLTGALQPGVTSTDLVLTVTEALRKHDLVGKIIEFHGNGLDSLSVPDRATLGNMAPEYGANMGFSPLDAKTMEYLRQTGRDEHDIALAENYAKAQMMWADGADTPQYAQVITIELDRIKPSAAGPRRPQDRLDLEDVPGSFDDFLDARTDVSKPGPGALSDGDIVIAAITSCTNTSNPSLMIAAGLVARNAVAAGLTVAPKVKTSLSPGSRVVSAYLAKSGLQDDLDRLGFQVTGFGCMTCAGGSGQLAADIEEEIRTRNLSVTAVLSGNRNFEGRTHPLVRAAYLASPPLIVAYALAGTVRIDLANDPLGKRADGSPVYLADLWPDLGEIDLLTQSMVTADQFREQYGRMQEADEFWEALAVPEGEDFRWDNQSTYLLRPPFLDDVTGEARNISSYRLENARPLLILGDDITTDHISPGSAIPANSAAGQYLLSLGVPENRFSSYIGRRGNHNVMMRGTFANIRIRNLMVPGTEGGITRHLPSGDTCTIHEAAGRYRAEGVPQIVIAGRNYGNGSSRDWAAKGTRILGVQCVVADSFERIHRSNLVGMGVLPLQTTDGHTAETLGLTGDETFDIIFEKGLAPKARGYLRISSADARPSREIPLLCRLETAREAEIYAAGGILPYAMNEMISPIGN